MRSNTPPRGSDLALLVAFEDEALAGRSPMTVRNVSGALMRFAAWLEPRQLFDATTGDVTAWLDSLPASRQTRNTRLRSLHRFYNWALNDGRISRDPAAPLVRIREPMIAGELPEVLRGFVTAQERRALSRATISCRLHRVRLFADWLAPKSILDACAADVELFLDAARGRGRDGALSAKSRYDYLSNLHVFYLWARRQGLIEKDPTADIDRPRLSTAIPRPIPTTELARALDEANPEVRVILALAAYCGLRAKEVAGVRREDILEHLDEPILIVAAPKGRRQRTVPLHPEAWRAIDQYRPPHSGPLLRLPDGRPWQPWKVSQAANDYLAGLGIRHSLHKLRHWYATQVYGKSLDLRLTQELMGHASPTTTAMYVAYNKARASEVVGQLSVGEVTA